MEFPEFGLWSCRLCFAVIMSLVFLPATYIKFHSALRWTERRFKTPCPAENVVKCTHKITGDISFFTNHTERKKLLYTYAYKSYA